MQNIFSRDDIAKVGKWVLLLSVMMAFIMAVQFQADRDSFWNRGVIGEFDQLGSALGKGRPPGTFSFSTGPALFFPLVAAFLVYGCISKKTYNIFLVAIAGISFFIAAAVSGNRTLLVGTAIVLLAALASVLAKPHILIRFFKLFLIIGVLLLVAVSIPLFHGGVEVLSARIEGAGGVKEGILKRIGGDFQAAFEEIERTPFLGNGIGTSTSVASQLLKGDRKELWVENEWIRCLTEEGLLLGLLYILFRIILVCFLFAESYKSLQMLDLLPMLLFGACAPNVLFGNFGQANILGFAVFVAGLCLAAAKRE